MALNYEGLIPILAGAYLFLLAHGTLPAGKDPAKAEQWRKQWAGTLKWLAPLVVLFGVALLLRWL